MGLLLTLLLGIFIIIGAIIVFITKNNDKFIEFSISLACGVILMLITTHLLPEAYEKALKETNLPIAEKFLTIFSFYKQLLISKGYEKYTNYLYTSAQGYYSSDPYAPFFVRKACRNFQKCFELLKKYFIVETKNINYYNIYNQKIVESNFLKIPDSSLSSSDISAEFFNSSESSNKAAA